MVHVSRRTRTICVKFSSWPQAQNPVYLEDTLRAFDAVGGVFARSDQVGGVPGVPGLVSGLSRHGGPAAPSPPRASVI
jgi:hypothetical protein